MCSVTWVHGHSSDKARQRVGIFAAEGVSHNVPMILEKVSRPWYTANCDQPARPSKTMRSWRTPSWPHTWYIFHWWNISTKRSWWCSCTNFFTLWKTRTKREGEPDTEENIDPWGHVVSDTTSDSVIFIQIPQISKASSPEEEDSLPDPGTHLDLKAS